jgi:hypothetical protein
MRTFFLALVILSQLGTLAYAQVAQPETNAPKPAVTNNPQINDIDKERVQNRWGTSSGTPSSKPAKQSKPEKAKPQNSSGINQ